MNLNSICQNCLFPPETNLINLLGKASIGRTPQGLVAKIEMSAQTTGECSRCLDPAEIRVATEFTELYAFNERSQTESQLLLPKNHQIDLAPLIREYLILDVPLANLCKVDCKGLCSVCGINHNHEDCEHINSSTFYAIFKLTGLFQPRGLIPVRALTIFRENWRNHMKFKKDSIESQKSPDLLFEEKENLESDIAEDQVDLFPKDDQNFDRLRIPLF